MRDIMINAFKIEDIAHREHTVKIYARQ